jgi:cyclic pyranopterin phosphate synthase
MNAVIMKNINEDEMIKLYDFSKERGIELRYIEYMENEYANSHIETLTSKEVLEEISKKHKVNAIDHDEMRAASKMYQDESGYRFGIIEPHDDSFCKNCNRIRLSAEGDIIPCLYYEDSQNVKSALNKKDLKEAKRILDDVIKNKPEKNKWSYAPAEDETSSRAFYFTGG